ncbi:hypothetical protein [Halomonas sp. H10-9-1]|uniref:hypothetical protein n=1 Tax=Halomonas sp. H10-9-1 TaxID=2950871 RepID=UPI0032DEAFB3
MPKRKDERSIVPLLAVVGVVAAPLIFMLGIVAGSQIQLANILTADSLSSWISAIATVTIAVLTFVLAKETWYLREAQIEQVNELRVQSIRPNVSVKFFSSRIAFNLMMLEISNLGKGIARNVRFKFYDKSGNEIKATENAIVDEFLKLHVMSEGLHSLGINQKFESFLFSFYEVKEKIDGDDIFSPYFKISTSYEDVEGNSYSDELVIDFKEFDDVSEIGGGDPLHKMSGDIKKLREQIEGMTRSSSKRLHVNTYSSLDRRQESEERQRWLDERKAIWEQENSNNKSQTDS